MAGIELEGDSDFDLGRGTSSKSTVTKAFCGNGLRRVVIAIVDRMTPPA